MEAVTLASAILLTGRPSTGIGLSTVKHLALHGAKVYFTARSEAKATKAKESLLSDNNGLSADKLVWLQLDLSDFNSIIQAAEELAKKEQKLDILGTY